MQGFLPIFRFIGIFYHPGKGVMLITFDVLRFEHGDFPIGRDRLMDMKDKNLMTLEEICEEMPFLATINWTPKMLVTLIRGQMLYGTFDSSAKVWLTSRAAVKRALDSRKRELMFQATEPEDYC